MPGWSDKLPDAVSGRARALGDEGVRWMQSLDETIAALEARWAVSVERALGGGSHAFVGLASDRAGEKYILKIDLPDETQQEYMRGVRALRRAQGNGYCRLLAEAGEKRAVLLERLGERLSRSPYSPAEQMRIICRALKKTWAIPVDPEAQPGDYGNHVWFREFIPSLWEELGHPCDEGVIDTALRYLDDLEGRTDPAAYVTVHGDAHNNNMLLTPGTGEYKFIDPDGLIFEKSYDMGVLMREWPEEFAGDAAARGRERCAFLSGLSGVAEEDIWEWGFLQMTATALLLIQIGQRDLGDKMLKIAETWCRGTEAAARS